MTTTKGLLRLADIRNRIHLLERRVAFIAERARAVEANEAGGSAAMDRAELTALVWAIDLAEVEYANAARLRRLVHAHEPAWVSGLHERFPNPDRAATISMAFGDALGQPVPGPSRAALLRLLVAWDYPEDPAARAVAMVAEAVERGDEQAAARGLFGFMVDQSDLVDDVVEAIAALTAHAVRQPQGAST